MASRVQKSIRTSGRPHREHRSKKGRTDKRGLLKIKIRREKLKKIKEKELKEKIKEELKNVKK